MANETMHIFFPLKIITYPQGEYGLDDSPLEITFAEGVVYKDAILAVSRKRIGSLKMTAGITDSRIWRPGDGRNVYERYFRSGAHTNSQLFHVTAVAQAEYCVDNGLTINSNDLVPGDLVFFSHDINGRFMDITHVAIYTGDGIIVDALSLNGQVVFRKLFSGQVLYGRLGV